ncbi:glycosyltransferase family 2 protein [Flavobacterium sp. AS60]|uniref:glycosyltransferase family 2 protein n=1 Tax=Flavobacterium anseongense TaxID=2910677 RepID=UPI001F2E3FDE|nr:glycosyltransferase family A protein [Flavobacterium sp. AS60]MCF6129928.1 glycosyltransferase family 2 protein [Flavobacterium sp. AS60]
MIVFYHNKSKISEIVSTEAIDFSNDINRNVVAVLLDFAQKFKDEIIVWCHESEKSNLNITEIAQLFHHKKMLLSYNPETDYFDRRLGYIEDSPYIKINKEVRYASWQMSSRVGAVHASVLNACKNDLYAKDNFDYFLNSFARRAMLFGLLCYSEPKLLLQNKVSEFNNESSLQELFKFTKQHYKARWVFLLFFNLLLFEKKFSLLPFLSSLCYKRRKLDSKLLNQIPLESNKKIVEQGTIDVLIPTIGRKDYLFNVLNNLAAQTFLPKNVIVIEQNPDMNSTSDLDFIQNKKWPFVIKQHFTHQTGACNARNIGLLMIESEFTFMADDDIIFENDLLEIAMKTFQTIGNEVFLVACHLKEQTVIPQLPMQFPVFGAGHAFVKSSCIKGLKFNMGFEFGFGEDADFGMQLRNKGFDILYISTTTILHLKAPIGGFRTKPILGWQHDEIQPKPSPTVMLYRLMYDTKEQIQNYKSMIFIKNLNSSFLKNPFKYIKTFRQKWNRSVYWATELKKRA